MLNLRASAAVFAVALLAAGQAWSQADVRADAVVSMEAAMSRGVAMAQRGEWDLAIKYFRTAARIKPTDPAVLFNIGLASDRSGKRVLAAIAWYNAFLAAAPDAQMAPQVRKRVTELEIDAETQTAKLLEAARSAITQLPPGQDASAALARLVRAEATGGDEAAAQRDVQRITNPQERVWPLAVIVAAKAQSGRIEAAQTGIAALAPGRAKAWAQAEVAAALAQRRDFAAAVTYADGITTADQKAWALSRVAALGAAAGVTDAFALAERIDEKFPAEKAVAYAALAAAAARSGAVGGKSAAELWSLAEAEMAKVKDYGERSKATVLFARYRAQAGDDAEANRLAEGLAEDSQREQALKLIARARGDPAADIHRWNVLALKAEDGGSGDIDTLVRDAQVGSPVATATAIAVAAERRARLLQAFRQPD